MKKPLKTPKSAASLEQQLEQLKQLRPEELRSDGGFVASKTLDARITPRCDALLLVIGPLQSHFWSREAEAQFPGWRRPARRLAQALQTIARHAVQ
jgi:hypothetical protein